MYTQILSALQDVLYDNNNVYFYDNILKKKKKIDVTFVFFILNK